MYHRIFVEWKDGPYISSLDPEFQKELVKMVLKYGHPEKVEFRASDEGWIVEEANENN